MQLTRIPTLINRLKRQLLSHVNLMRAVLVVLVLACIALVWFVLSSPFYYIRSFSSMALPSSGGRTNILVLGVGGDGHEAPDLTDTILFFSIRTRGTDPVLLSLPRDIWVPSLKAKINTAYYYGKKKQGPSGGLTLAKAAVSEIIDQPVHLAVVLDFGTFSKAIDLVGGIDLDIPRSFDDYKYPLPGKENDLCAGDPEYLCRYEHVHFDAGQQHHDGNTALKYVRSRNSADPEEGTDFARNRRQEQVISAFKNRLLSREIITHPAVYRELYDLFLSESVTDITQGYYFALAKLAFRARRQSLKTAALSEPDQLSHPPVSAVYGGQWVLITKNNDSQIVTGFVSSLLK
ncbi:MAG: Cell envelope-related transcriptional attenuator [Candidatus Amesbacteria bacterium GW2011_GWB1_47_19]|nr:MAG: Cell envelope-related transcriptional attenuator [Candidatus Amesbacteria bacterium GW2011_GWA1_44_24]KKU32070.1 MAG: cell envelope-related transcriptional attenuator [Candidatus Amesbacteria bacterium GW2011_GWC1_46_24]KKU67754.1 MAG: Cell envelope-related transcriptional attenuator [Candidatus Amesbacteria bacterium GW2011_GWB1_47_19]OGD06061.1 MAG: hypothetical protein A2379_03135 [Candidatus Amesbacteria bacterium RIFOXYB1_FULL_47_13]